MFISILVNNYLKPKQMKINKISYIKQVSIGLLVMAMASCSERDLASLVDAFNPTTAEVYTDALVCDGFDAWGKTTDGVISFDEMENVYKGTKAIKIEVPLSSDAPGWVGGVMYTKNTPRNLSPYNALTFYVKSSQATTMTAGLGTRQNGTAPFGVSYSSFPVSTVWQKVIIPIPNSSVLTAETGFFNYSIPGTISPYQVYIDEIKFEKLGTLANVKPQILGGVSKTTTAETGDKYTIDGLSETVSLPNGVDQTMSIGPGYYTFSSSNTAVATVDASGVVSILDAGTAVITAKIGDTTAAGDLTITSIGNPVLPTQAAPTPTVDAKNVISLFSNAYPNVPVDFWNTHWQYSTAENKDYKIGADDIKRYLKLNFVGIEFKSNPINASQMTRFHMDVWTPESTALPKAFKVQLVDFGANGVYGGGDDSSSELSFTSPTLATGKWVSIDVALPAFTGLKSKAHLAQMVLSGDISNVFIDNVYFYNSANIVPTEAAPAPTQSAANVMSIFSDTYTNLPGTDFNPNWGQSTVVSDMTISGNHVKKYGTFNYQGTDLGATTDFTGMKYLHIDLWTLDATVVKVSPISKSSGESLYSLTPLSTGKWNSYNIPLTEFTKGGMTMKDIYQLKFDGQAGVSPSNIYLDNIYFYTMPTVPEQAAPTPTTTAANVISVFSDTYTNVPGTDFNPNWGQSTVVSQVAIGGNNTLKLAGLNYQGIQLSSNQNVSAMNYLHVDFWSANSTSLNIYAISPGPVEKAYNLTVPTSGWTSLDIPLTAFSPVDLTNVFQFKFDGNGTIYMDNIYFHK
jgi:hypothetical protein